MKTTKIAFHNEIIPQRNCSPSAEELKRMTLQVGLVGADGIVLASDRLVNNYESGEPVRTLTSKFARSDEVVCCWSGDRAAIYAADYICDTRWSEVPHRALGLRECGDRGFRKLFGAHFELGRNEVQPTRKVLAAFRDDCSLWELDVFDRSSSSPVFDKTVAGGSQTAARHLINNYTERHMPVENLIVIASHVILTTGKEDNANVGGLEVAIIRKGELVFFLPPERERELEGISESIHKEISKLLIRPFSYRPVTPPPV